MDEHIPAGAPDDLFITDALDSRDPGAGDFGAEAKAIQALAFTMADTPERALPHFVDLAMRLTGGASAGLSVYEPRAQGDGVFVWRFLQGALDRFEGASTPRNFSPCGVTLDRNTAVLTRHPERTYGWIAEAGVKAPEVLLVPLRLTDGAPFGTLWVVGEEGLFTRDHAALLEELAQCIAAPATAWSAGQLAET